jgi:hypothetical protein
MRLLLALISTVLLTACQTGAGGNPPARSSEITANKVSDANEIGRLAGSGPVTLSPEVEDEIASINHELGGKAGAIAVSFDGKSLSSIHCVKQECEGSLALAAKTQCELRSLGKKCFLYMQNGKVVWNFSGPVRASDREFVAGTKITLKWLHSGRQVETGISWQNALKWYGLFYLKSEEAGAVDCMGLVRKGNKYRHGSWNVNCADRPGYMHGDIAFDGDRADGHGINSDVERIIITIR